MGPAGGPPEPSVAYTLTDPWDLLNDRNRRREEAAIREVDGAEASLHRAKKARWQQGVREQRRDFDEETVLRVQWTVWSARWSVMAHADAVRRREELSERLFLCNMQQGTARW